jgi:hypothetical protein
MFAYETWFVLFDSLPYQRKVPLNWHWGKNEEKIKVNQLLFYFKIRSLIN